MVGVNVSDYGDLDKALRIFRSKVRKAHILEMVNRKSHYVSPSEKRHRTRGRRKPH